MLLGFIDLFGITPFICILDNNYDGEDISLAYGYDLLRKREDVPNIIFSEIPLNFKDRYNFQTTKTERLSHCRKNMDDLFQLLVFYSIPEKIIQDLLATVNYDSSVSGFFSELKPQLQEFIISNIDRLFPQKEKGCYLIHECILRGMQTFFRDSESELRNKS